MWKNCKLNAWSLSYLIVVKTEITVLAKVQVAPNEVWWWVLCVNFFISVLRNFLVQFLVLALEHVFIRVNFDLHQYSSPGNISSHLYTVANVYFNAQCSFHINAVDGSYWQNWGYVAWNSHLATFLPPNDNVQFNSIVSVALKFSSRV